MKKKAVRDAIKQDQQEAERLALRAAKRRTREALLIASKRSRKAIAASQPRNIFRPVEPPPGVLPSGTALAMDDVAPFAQWAGQAPDWAYYEGLAFLGYPVLSELAQRPEYRRLVELVSTEATRKWIKFKAVGKVKKGAKIAKIEARMEELSVAEHCRVLSAQDGFFGRSHLYIDTGSTDHPEELITDIGDGKGDRTQTKFKKGFIKALRPVEAVWTYPTTYNSRDPLQDDWYKPTVWYVMGKQIHRSRLLTFIGRPVPDLLKPAYSFGGLALSQMVKPYVDRWLSTAQSVNDIIQSFTTYVLKTNLGESLQADGDDVFTRVETFNNFRRNSGTLVLDKDSEDFANIAVPLGGLDLLQAQSQEHICSVSGTPVVKYLGIQPAGLNASSEGEITCWEDWIHSYQRAFFKPNLDTLVRLIQIDLFGEVDDQITYEFEPLEEMSPLEKAQIQGTKVKTARDLIDGGVLAPEEERQRLVDDPESDYQGLDPDDVPDLQGEEEEGLQPIGGKPNPIEEDKPEPGKKPSKVKAAGSAGASDEFKEADHPRGQPGTPGQFGSGGGGSTSAEKPQAAKKTKAVSYGTTKVANGKRVTSEGTALPEHVEKLKIPPAWTDVEYAHDPDADLLATGKDVKGRRQAIYSDKFVAKQAALKFSRISSLAQEFPAIQAQNEALRKAESPRTRGAADCLALIMATGIRPGSEDDTGAEKQAYGATTLEGRHVGIAKSRVTLTFVGKKGVDLSIPVEDPSVAKMLVERKKAAGANGQIFPINEKMLLDHVHSLGSGSYKSKDFRTLLGTQTAMGLVAKGEKPKDEKEYKKSVMEVAKAVSQKLGNTPTIALQSYINPAVFAEWRIEL